MFEKVKRAADRIVWQYQMGNYNRIEAHNALNELNDCCFAMYNFGLADVDPGKTQDYIHALQEKYTIEFV